jgi:hypothetical protein
MLVINEKDKVSKKIGEYFVNNGLNKNDPIKNPEKYIVRIDKLKMDCVVALFEQKKILVTDTKDYDKHTDLGFICFWYDDCDDMNQQTIFLDMQYTDIEDDKTYNARAMIFRYYDKIYDALVKNKIIFEV